LTKEVWEQINYLYYFVKEGIGKKELKESDPRLFFKKSEGRVGQLLYGFGHIISRNDGGILEKLVIDRTWPTKRHVF